LDIQKLQTEALPSATNKSIGGFDITPPVVDSKTDLKSASIKDVKIVASN